jgi:hypothetical protein
MMMKPKIDEATAIMIATAWALKENNISPEGFVRKLAHVCNLYGLDQNKITNTWMSAIQAMALLMRSGELN